MKARSAILALGITLLAAGVPPRGVYAEENDAALTAADSLSRAFESASNLIKPSVVSISSVKKAKARPAQMRRGGSNPQEQLREFFGDDFYRFFGAPNPPEGFAQQGLGTGVIASEDGLIITNNHVIEDADEISVRTDDGKSHKAELVGADPKTDIALVRIKASGLTAAKFGDSDALKIGEWVVAAGSPFGLEKTITAGIVSAKGRSSITDPDTYQDFIQTDAAINPGNSGGPLINLHGEIVGINTAILSRSGGYMGIGFAIPINMVKDVKNSLLTKGRVVRGWLGVIIQNLNDDLAASFGISHNEGALVSDVSPDSPAAKAGLQQGDIIIKFGETKIADINQLRNLVASTTPGSKIPVIVHREGKETTIMVDVTELPANVGSNPTKPVPEEAGADIGLQLQNLTPEMASQIGTKRTNGVVVTGVEPNGLAARGGLRPQDILVKLNGVAITSVSQFSQEMKKLDLKKGVRIVAESQGMQRFVFLKDDE